MAERLHSSDGEAAWNDRHGRGADMIGVALALWPRHTGLATMKADVIWLRTVTPFCVGYPIDTEWLFTFGSMGIGFRRRPLLGTVILLV